jgi:hypothetical protein
MLEMKGLMKPKNFFIETNFFKLCTVVAFAPLPLCATAQPSSVILKGLSATAKISRASVRVFLLG